MADYVRTTRECTLESLRPELMTALREHIEKYQLDRVEASSHYCCETTSVKQKKGLFGGSAEVTYSGVVITPQWLVWAVSTAKGQTSAQSARWRDVQVLDYERSPEYKLMPDTGVVIHGRFTNAEEISSVFIGLGDDAAAGKLRQALREAIEKANQ